MLTEHQESEMSVRIIQLGTSIQREMANSYRPNIEAILAACDQLKDCAKQIQKWAKDANNTQKQSMHPSGMPEPQG